MRQTYDWLSFVIEVLCPPLHVWVWPTDSVVAVIKACKAATARELSAKYRGQFSLPSLWTKAYLASTVERVSDETIDQFIEMQKGPSVAAPAYITGAIIDENFFKSVYRTLAAFSATAGRSGGAWPAQDIGANI